MMTTPIDDAHVTHLFRYEIASADMYYTEMEQRDVFLSCDERANFRFWGEITDGGPSTTINLFEIFLEYGMYCCSWAGAEESCYHMQDFGERLGRSLAKLLKENIAASMSENAAIAALKHIFETVDACPSLEEHFGAEVHFMIENFPLTKTARRSGLQNIELARRGIDAMCQSLIQNLDPHLTLHSSSDDVSEFIFTILAPSFA